MPLLRTPAPGSSGAPSRRPGRGHGRRQAARTFLGLWSDDLRNIRASRRAEALRAAPLPDHGAAPAGPLRAPRLRLQRHCVRKYREPCLRPICLRPDARTVGPQVRKHAVLLQLDSRRAEPALPWGLLAGNAAVGQVQLRLGPRRPPHCGAPTSRIRKRILLRP